VDCFGVSFFQLADVAADMDRRECAALGGAGLESESNNVRADGFFSVQVWHNRIPYYQ